MTVSKEKKEASECYTCGGSNYVSRHGVLVLCSDCNTTCPTCTGMGSVMEITGNQKRLVACPECFKDRYKALKPHGEPHSQEDPGDVCPECLSGEH